jgi:phosphoribosylanthranilate isomerase
MKFKVCGLFDKENIFNVAQLNPDYIGHIFWEKSVRYVKGDTPQIDNSKKTGVFYNSNYDFISKKLKIINLNVFSFMVMKHLVYVRNF